MRNIILFVSVLVFFTSCEKDNQLPQSLREYIDVNADLEISNKLIACALGGDSSSLHDEIKPISVLFLPVEGATDFSYFETSTLNGKRGNYAEYSKMEMDEFPLFNGVLRGFSHRPIKKEVWGIVTYKTPGKLHISTPIRLKYAEKPTEVNDSLLVINELGTRPRFLWDDGRIDENEIYFQVVTDTLDNFISGTYTYEKIFRFYETENVVLNITSDPNPTLEPFKDYQFVLMGVSKDNWVNLTVERRFSTN